MNPKKKAQEVIIRLSKIWPHPHTALKYTNPFELLVATILSAQANDRLVNQVTPELFKKYKTPQDYANAPFMQLDNDIKRVNFHGNKAKNIIAAASIIAENFNGKVPNTMEELDALPGVARKTANVVLGNAFHQAEGIVVDTHVMRLSRKLGLTKEKDPVKIEQDLMKIVPQKRWIDFSHLLINFGRQYCTARMPSCKNTPLGDLFIDE